MVVPLAGDLLAGGKKCLNATQIHQRVPVIALLDDAVDNLAHAIDVLVVHHLALRLANTLQHHLLGGLRRDAAEVLGRQAHWLDLLGPIGRPVDVRRRRLELLGINPLGDLRLRARESDQLGALREHQPIYLHLARLAINIHACPLNCPWRLAIRREQGVLKRHQEDL